MAGLPATLDDFDLHLGDGLGIVTVEERFDVAAGRLGLDDLERAVLAAVALRDLSPELAAALSQLAPAAAGEPATARTVARLLAGPGVSVADVLVVLGPGQRLRGLGALRVAAAARGAGPRPARRQAAACSPTGSRRCCSARRSTIRARAACCAASSDRRCRSAARRRSSA